MAQLPPRDLEHEAHAHFRGTAAERVQAALRLGRDALALFLATLPAGTTRAQARRLMQANKQRGRRPSAALEARRS